MAEKSNANIGFEKQIWDAALRFMGTHSCGRVQKGYRRSYIPALHIECF